MNLIKDKVCHNLNIGMTFFPCDSIAFGIVDTASWISLKSIMQFMLKIELDLDIMDESDTFSTFESIWTKRDTFLNFFSEYGPQFLNLRLTFSYWNWSWDLLSKPLKCRSCVNVVEIWTLSIMLLMRMVLRRHLYLNGN